MRRFGPLVAPKDKMKKFPETHNFMIWQSILYVIFAIIMGLLLYYYITTEVDVMKIEKYKDIDKNSLQYSQPLHPINFNITMDNIIIVGELFIFDISQCNIDLWNDYEKTIINNTITYRLIRIISTYSYEYIIDIFQEKCKNNLNDSFFVISYKTHNSILDVIALTFANFKIISSVITTIVATYIFDLRYLVNKPSNNIDLRGLDL